MFHLFDKIYLEFDTKVSYNFNRIVISNKGAAQLDPETTVTQTNQFHYAKTVDTLIGVNKAFATELDFFKGLKLLGDNNSGPLIIYCDKPAFLHLFISWHKSILENVSVEDLWKIFRFSIEKETYLSKFINLPNYLTYDNYSIENWSIEEFTTKFNNLVIDKDRQWNKEMIPSLGIEVLLSSYLLSPSDLNKSVLKSKILLLATRTILIEIYEAKFELIVNYQNKNLHDILAVSNIETLDELFLHPRTSIFVDERLWSKDGLLYPNDNKTALNINAINETDISKLIDGFNIARVELPGFQKSDNQSLIINRLPWIVKGSLTDQELNSLLNDKNLTATTLSEATDQEKVNILFVDWILKLHRNSNLSEISGLQVAV